MEAFYIETNNHKIFSIYHPPENLQGRGNIGIVLCYPMGQEYIRSHRTFFQLANLLSNQGYHVIRFDYYGTGDSYGQCHEASIKQWQYDISSVVDELKYGCGIERICLIGLRLGGNMAINVASIRDDIDGIVLWEPVFSGKKYYEELEMMHRDKMLRSFNNRNHKEASSGGCEILGFAFSHNLKNELQQIELQACKSLQHKKILCVYRFENPEIQSCIDLFSENNTVFKQECSHSPEFWKKQEGSSFKQLVPNDTIKSILTWIENNYE